MIATANGAVVRQTAKAHVLTASDAPPAGPAIYQYVGGGVGVSWFETSRGGNGQLMQVRGAPTTVGDLRAPCKALVELTQQVWVVAEVEHTYGVDGNPAVDAMKKEE